MERQEARLSQEIASLIIHIDELDKSIAIEEEKLWFAFRYYGAGINKLSTGRASFLS